MKSNSSPNHSALNLSALLSLAPFELPSYRSEHFWGDALNVSLKQFSEVDRASVQELYALLQELLALVQHRLDEPDICQQELHHFIEQRHWLDTMSSRSGDSRAR